MKRTVIFRDDDGPSDLDDDSHLPMVVSFAGHEVMNCLDKGFLLQRRLQQQHGQRHDEQPFQLNDLIPADQIHIMI